MIIVSKDKQRIVNFDYVIYIYIDPNELSIKVDFSNAKGYELERYSSKQDVLTALEMLCDAINEKSNKFEMPTNKQVKAKQADMLRVMELQDTAIFDTAFAEQEVKNI